MQLWRSLSHIEINNFNRQTQGGMVSFIFTNEPKNINRFKTINEFLINFICNALRIIFYEVTYYKDV